MTAAKHPELCDFCGASTPTKRLVGWPCATFEMITSVYDETLYVACTCHTTAEIPLGAQVVERRTCIGPWAACPPCRADVDAGRWPDLARRYGRVFRREQGEILPAPLQAGVAGFHAMFRDHATPPEEGSWQPVSDAVVDAEIALYEAQRRK